MNYPKHTVQEKGWQIRTLKRWQRKLPANCRLKTVLYHDYWWVELPDGTSVVSARSAYEAVQRALLVPAVIQAATDAAAAAQAAAQAAEADREAGICAPEWKRKLRQKKARRERWKESWM